MLFEKFIEEHRVHLVVAHAVRFSFLVADDQVRANFFNIFRYQPTLRNPLWIYLLRVMEANWFERKDRFAGPFHWLNLLFESPRSCAELTESIDEHGRSGRGCCAEDMADVATVGQVLTSLTDTDYLVRCRHTDACAIPNAMLWLPL